jgi:maltokinase
VAGSLARTLHSLRSAVDRFGETGLREQRWFAGKGRAVAEVGLADAVEVPGGEGALLAIADVGYADGGAERYALPCRLAGDGALVDAEPGDPVWSALAHAITEGRELEGHAGAFVSHAGARVAVPDVGRRLDPDQSNTSVVLGDALVVKCYRRLETGMHPEPEALEALARVGARVAPPWHGTLTYRASDGDAAVAVVYGFVPGGPLGWEPAIVRLRDALEVGKPAVDLLDTAGELGATTRELHRSFGQAFGTSVASSDDARRVSDAALAALGDALAALPVGIAGDVVARATERLGPLRRLEGATVSRLHGDLHVAQFVRSPAGLVVVDFEGEPGTTLGARRAARSPLRDLACLLLSLDHVAAAAARRLGFGTATDAAFAWSADARERVIDAYGDDVDPALLGAFEVEKECRELLYALRVVPEWLYAPRLVLPRLLGIEAA